MPIVDNRENRSVIDIFTPVNVLVILAVAVIAATVWSYRYFGKYSPFASLLTGQNDQAMSQIGLTIDDARVSIRSGGQKRLRVAAREVIYSRDHRVVTINGLHDGVLYDGREKPSVTFDAGRMEYDTPSGQISTTIGATVRLTNGIHATVLKDGGMHLTTSILEWDAPTGKLRAPGAVDIVFPRNSGAATTSDILFNTQTHNLFARHVHGTFHASKLVQ